jgi:hypothetical protein
MTTRRIATLALLVFELLVAGFAAVVAIVMFVSLNRSGSDAWDNEWSWFTLVVAAITFVSFGIAALGLMTSWRFRWWLQAVPVVALVAGVVLFVFAV